MPQLNRQSLVRLAALLLVLLLVLGGTGLGTDSSISEFVRENSERISGITDGDTQGSADGETPRSPPAEQTPPTETPTETSAGTPTPQSTPGTTATPAEGTGPADTATATESTTTVTSRGAENSGATRAAPTALDLDLGGAGQTNIFDTGEGAGADGGVTPGASGVNRVTLTNSGERGGVLELTAVEYTSYENGLTGPESAVDTTGGDPGVGAGELHDALEIRLSLVAADGSSRYVVGTETSYRTIASLANATVVLGPLDAGESVDLVVEFRVPVTVGNEIQSDTIVVDVQFSLVDAN